jgi:GH24 family phage-related lysozyme (muramidase)
MDLKELRNYLRRENIKLADLEKSLILNEGFKTETYFRNNIRHFGVGHNCEANPLTEKEEEIIRFDKREFRIDLSLNLMVADIKEAGNGVYRTFGELTRHFTKSQYNALCEMVFQLGIGSFQKFGKTINFIKSGMWEEAAKEALRSKWGRTHKKRAKKVVQGFTKTISFSDWQRKVK